MEHLVHYNEITTRISADSTRASIILKNSTQVGLRVARPDVLSAALVYFVGLELHNIALHKLMQAQGLKTSEYDVSRGKERIAGQMEASAYRAVGLPWICPEPRKSHGEVVTA